MITIFKALIIIIIIFSVPGTVNVTVKRFCPGELQLSPSNTGGDDLIMVIFKVSQLDTVQIVINQRQDIWATFLI